MTMSPDNHSPLAPAHEPPPRAAKAVFQAVLEAAVFLAALAGLAGAVVIFAFL